MYADRGGTLTEPVAHPDELTPRQREVLDLLALGHTDEQIGQTLGISAKTVRFHTGCIYQRMPGQALGSQRVAAARWRWATTAA